MSHHLWVLDVLALHVLTDIGGVNPVCAPPKAPDSFLFDMNILWNLAASGVHALPLWYEHPPPMEIVNPSLTWKKSNFDNIL